MNYIFDKEIAEEYGLEEAIVYQNIQFWCLKNEANGTHIYEGRAWTYNTLEAWQELFSFWSKDKIFRILKRMVEKGMISKGHFDKNPFVRVTYYSDNLQNAYCGSAISDIADPQNVQIANMQNDYKGTDVNDCNKPDTNGDDADSSFEDFWNAYGKKTDHKKAKAKYISLYKKGLIPDNLIEVVKKWKNTDSWKKNNGMYQPLATTWLNGERWEDELPYLLEQSTYVDRERNIPKDEHCSVCGHKTVKGFCTNCGDDDPNYKREQ